MSITDWNIHENVNMMEANSNYTFLKYDAPTLPTLESKSKFGFGLLIVAVKDYEKDRK